MAEFSLARLGEKLGQTWPARLAKDAWGAVTLPGDVYQGNVSMYGDDGRTNPEVINRSMDLAGLVTGGSYAAPAMKDASGMGIRAYHGSPHDFDRFDLSKIGTGEGAQAYGHGLYFAENEGVAKGYRDALAPKALIKPDADMLDPQRIAAELFDSYRGQNLKDALGDASFYDNGKAVAAELRKIYANPPKGHMYEVNINADPAHFLDWDKALRDQNPTVKDALRKTVWGDDYVRTSMPGGQVAPKNDAATEALREAGLPGIKYLDQGSRAPVWHVQPAVVGYGSSAKGPWAAKPGGGNSAPTQYFDSENAAQQFITSENARNATSNYVVFDDKLIDIMRKYGLAGLAPLAGYGAMQQGQQPSPRM